MSIKFKYRFIINSVFFSLIFILSLFPTGFIYKEIVLNNVYNPESFTLAVGDSVLIIGDSHSMTAFNDSIIYNSFNASVNSENLMQTFYKLKTIKEANPSLKKIIFGFSPHNISFKSEVLYGQKYYPLLDADGKEIFWNANDYGLIPDGFISKYKNQLFLIFLKIKYDYGLPLDFSSYIDYLFCLSKSEKLYVHPLFTKPYKSNETNLSNELTQKILNRHYSFQEDDIAISDIMVSYFYKIILFCKVNDIKLFIFGTPLHSSYNEKIPGKYKETYLSLIDSALACDKHISFYDYSNISICDSLWGDADHLNFNGGMFFSRIVNTIINKN